MDHEDGDGVGTGLDGGVDGDSGGGWRSLSKVIPAAFPQLQSSPAAAFCLLFRYFFCVSPPPPCETPRWTIFIVGFKSRRRHGDEDRRLRRLEAQDRAPTRPRNLAAWAHLFRPSGLRLPIRNARKTAALKGCPQRRGTCARVYVRLVQIMTSNK